MTVLSPSANRGFSADPRSLLTPYVGMVRPLAPGQLVTVWVDFGRYLPPGTTLMGTPSQVVTVFDGADPTPESIVTVAPQVGTIPIPIGGTGLTDTAILMQVMSEIAENIYSTEMTAQRSDGTDTVVGVLHIPISAVQPE